MNSGATSERVYDALKRRVLSGHYRPGERLEAATIGGELNSSVTPVRDALHTLVGEGLVVTRTSDGFHVSGIDAPALEDLYRWNADVLSIIAASIGNAGPWPSVGADPHDDAATLFLAFARRSGNSEHERMVAALNDRLSAPRRAEARLLPDRARELGDLEGQLVTGNARQRRNAIGRYHQPRVRRAADIVRELYRGQEPSQTIGE